MPEDLNNTPRPRSEVRKRAARERITDDVELGVERTVEGARRAVNKLDFARNFEWMESRAAIFGAVGGLVVGFLLGSALTQAMNRGSL